MLKKLFKKLWPKLVTIGVTLALGSIIIPSGPGIRFGETVRDVVSVQGYDSTTDLSLRKPHIGSQGWGTHLNANFDSLDDFLSGDSAVTGMIQAYPKTILYNWTDATTSTGGSYDTLKTITLPANSMGANGVCKIYLIWSATEDNVMGTDKKYTKIVFGGTDATVNTLANGDLVHTQEWIVCNKGATNSQIAPWSSAPGWGYTSGISGTLKTFSKDTTAAVTILIQGQEDDVDNGDALTLHGYWIEVTYVP